MMKPKKMLYQKILSVHMRWADSKPQNNIRFTYLHMYIFIINIFTVAHATACVLVHSGLFSATRSQ